MHNRCFWPQLSSAQLSAGVDAFEHEGREGGGWGQAEEDVVAEAEADAATVTALEVESEGEAVTVPGRTAEK